MANRQIRPGPREFLIRGEAEPTHRLRIIPLHALAEKVAKAEIVLCFRQARVRRGLVPGHRLIGVFGPSQSGLKALAEAVLSGVISPNCCLSIPSDRRHQVGSHPVPMLVAVSQIILGRRIPGIGGLLEPRNRLDRIGRDAQTHLVAETQGILRIGQAVIRSLAKPLHCLLRISRDATTGSIAASERILCWSVVQVCGPLKPLGGGRLIFGNPQTPLVKDPQTVLVFRAALDGFELGFEKLLMDS